jgi:putative peptidoglycan lipid II flippase
LLKGFRPSISTRVPGVREALGAFGPVVAGRGVYQLSGYLDMFLASLLSHAGAIAALRPAMMLYMLPVSLFGLSVAASELPELSRIREKELGLFLQRVDRSLRQTLFLTIPSAVGYLGLGFLIVGAFFRRGAFGLSDNWLVYLVLAGYSLGLLATTLSRLLQNSFYALQDTKTPARIAVVRVVISTVLSVPLMFLLDRYSVTETLGIRGQPLYLGAVGLALAASVSAWVEVWRLEATLRRRLPGFGLPWKRASQMVGLCLVALVPAALLWWLLAGWPVLVLAAVVGGAYGLTYLAAAHLLGFSEVEAWTGRFRRRLTR